MTYSAEGSASGVVTVMFTDAEHSTALATSKGDRAAREALGAHENIVRYQATQHDGRELKGLGDGLMVVFASPRKAVTCAVEVQRDVGRHNLRHPGDPIRIRIGLNTGEVIQEADDVFGEAVNAAARITAKADGGEVLVSEAVRRIVGTMPGLSFTDRGRFRLKGFDERWHLYRVTWEVGGADGGTAVVERVPLVGRDAEKARLVTLCREAIAGSGRVVLLGGEPGVGKTRLAEEVAHDARRLGMLTLVGHCYEGEGSVPYVSFVEIVEAALHAVPLEDVRAALGDAAADIARIVPELRRIFPDLPTPLELPAEQERRYLFRAVQQFLERASMRFQLLLILDDIHWGDTASLLLLEHLAEHVQSLPVLIIGTYRDVELEVGRPLARTMDRLIRRRVAERLPVRRLPPEGTAAMLRALSGQDAPRGVVGLIAAETEGNPFFIEEVYRHLAEEGRLLDSDGRWRANLRVSEVDVPQSIRLVIGRRLERLSAHARRVLTMAAGIGRAFDFQLLETLVGDDPDTLLDAVDEAERARLIVSAAEGPTATFTFAHELIRQTLFAELSLPRRQRLHLRVADAMELVYGPHAVDHAAEIAHHLVQAGAAASDGRRTMQYLRVAADHAITAAAFEDALRQIDAALELGGADDERTRADFLVLRGSAEQGLGRWDDAMTAWREALDLYERLGEGEVAGAVAANMAMQLAWSGKLVECVELAARSLSLIQEKATIARALMLAISGQAFAYSGSVEIGDGLMAEAVAIAEALHDQRTVGYALNCHAVRDWLYVDPVRCLEVGTRCLAAYRAAGDLFGVANIVAFNMFSHLYCGHVTEATTTHEELRSLADITGHNGATMSTFRGRGFLAVLAGDLATMEKAGAEDLAFCRRHQLPWSPDAHVILGLAAFWRGRWKQALAHFEEGVQDTVLPGALAGGPPAYRLSTLAHLGDIAAASAAAEELTASLPTPGQPMMLGQLAIACALIEVLPKVGRREAAAALYPLIVDRIAAGVVAQGWDLALLASVAGAAAAAAEHWEQSEEHFQVALRQAEQIPHPIGGAETRRQYATMLAERRRTGDAALARRLLGEALEVYQRIGMPRHAALAEDLGSLI